MKLFRFAIDVTILGDEDDDECFDHLGHLVHEIDPSARIESIAMHSEVVEVVELSGETTTIADLPRLRAEALSTWPFNIKEIPQKAGQS